MTTPRCCVLSLVLLLVTVPNAKAQDREPKDCPLGSGVILGEEELETLLLGGVSDARIGIMASACGIEMTDEQWEALRSRAPEHAGLLRSIARFRRQAVSPDTAPVAPQPALVEPLPPTVLPAVPVPDRVEPRPAPGSVESPSMPTPPARPVTDPVEAPRTPSPVTPEVPVTNVPPPVAVAPPSAAPESQLPSPKIARAEDTADVPADIAPSARRSSGRRSLLLMLGTLAISAGAGGMAMSEDGRIRSALDTARSIQPGPGATTRFNAAVSDAQAAERSRNLYRSVAIGSGTVGAMVMVVRMFRDDGPPSPHQEQRIRLGLQTGPSAVGVSITRRW